MGLYSPYGDSLYSVADMSGNVYEWTSTIYREYPYDVADGREELVTTNHGVVRGGSYYNNKFTARGTYRNNEVPDGVYHDAGFRLGWCPGRFLPRLLKANCCLLAAVGCSGLAQQHSWLDRRLATLMEI